MTTDLQLIAAPPLPVEKFTVNAEAIQMRDRALEQAALIGKVENAEQNNQCVNAKKALKSIVSLFESQRKKLKEPYLEAGRQIDRITTSESLEAEKELGRLECLEKDFIRKEQRRVVEEQEIQRRELARIEAEKQAELKRIADEQARVEREAREAREAADRLAAEATNKKQRAAAEAARVESERLAREAESKAREAAAQTQIVTEAASNAAYVESRPVDITRARGQAIRKVWVIDQINDFQLMKARPDLVRKIEWDLTGLKQALADGQKLPGVIAHEDIHVDTRGARNLEAIAV